MSQALLDPPRFLSAVTIRVPELLRWTDEQFFAVCAANRDLRFERTSEGDVIVMPPTGGETGNRNHEITRQLGNWAKRDEAGAAFDSSTGFKLPNRADRSPDAAWVRRERLALLPAAEKRKFIPLCPDFAVELLSPTDDLEDVQMKMDEYIANGALLGWLIDPERRRVYVYRPGRAVEVVEDAAQISGDPELPGFVLDLTEIWEPRL
jgi:Uma2 family endonuclease